MPTLGNTPRPAYVYDTETDTWVPVGVGAHTHSDIPNTLVDAKGDLITATADNVPARLAKGADGTVLVSDSTTSTGLAWQPYGAIQVAGKNLVINGGMDFFQRGSLATTTAGYGLDRWAQVSSGSGSNVTITQQTTGVPIGSRYCARITTGASAGYGNQFHYIETSNSATLWGKPATLSIKLRRSAAFAGTLSVVLSKSSTVDAGGGATWTTVGSTVVSNSLLPTGTTSSDWHTVTFTVTVPNDGSANSLRVSIQQSQVETSAYWEMAQCQLEEGTAATTFSRAGGTIQGELAACQRYFQALSWGPTYNTAIHSGHFWSSTKSLGTVHLKTTMRSNPAVSISSPSHVTVYSANATYSVSSIGVDATTPASFDIEFVTSSAGTAGYGTFNRITNSSGYLWISAEL
jgi:hypothetical protein